MANEWNIKTTGELPANIAMDKRLEEALNQIRTVPGAAEKFASDPETYLQSVGIETAGLKFAGGQTELSDADLAQVAGGGVCASGGYYVCVTAGN
jgi:hypothetical protein